MPAPWTLDSLERACRKGLVARSSVEVCQIGGDKGATVEWGGAGGHITVKIDNHDHGLRPATLHELLHVLLEKEMAPFDKKIAEDMLIATERMLNKHICKSKRRLAWWRKSISGKLKK